MYAKAKAAAMTTGIVLFTIWALRRVSMTRGIVDRALNG